MKSSEFPSKLYIYGDNILECEDALEIVSKSVGTITSFQSSPLYTPEFSLLDDDEKISKVKLLPGYGRWQNDVESILRKRGAPLREVTDAVIFQVDDNSKQISLKPLFSFEFCGSLPAGNNAWQRCGRALAMACADVPYLYFAEVGGIEFGQKRRRQQARKPNPLIPFAYFRLPISYPSKSVPIYKQSDSATPNSIKSFTSFLGSEDALDLIQALIFQNEDLDALQNLHSKALKATQTLTNLRQTDDSLDTKEWKQLAKIRNGIELAKKIASHKRDWSKRISINVTRTFENLQDVFEKHSFSPGSDHMPICIVPSSYRPRVASEIKGIYDEDEVSKDFMNWIATSKSPLVVVWIAGFKPEGEDSRPDRGLLPLARMIFGSEVDVLGIIYGPGRKSMWKDFIEDIEKLARTNGLWETIVYLSNGVIVDSTTSKEVPKVTYLMSYKRGKDSPQKISFQEENYPQSYGEQDVDSVIHMLFTQSYDSGIFESLCNPPGGDWSGLSVKDFSSNDEYRWTSLPRVTAKNSKRPDHVIQFSQNHRENIFLSIESKKSGAQIDGDIGSRLKNYVTGLLNYSPNAIKRKNDSSYRDFPEDLSISADEVYSGVTFIFRGTKNLVRDFKRTNVDFALGIKFYEQQDKVQLNLLSNEKADWIVKMIGKLSNQFNDLVEISVQSRL